MSVFETDMILIIKEKIMYKYILESAGSIDWMAIFALLTFFFIFSISVIAVFIKKQSFIDKMASLPLDDGLSNDDKI
jgi:hypothetical protein